MVTEGPGCSRDPGRALCASRPGRFGGREEHDQGFGVHKVVMRKRCISQTRGLLIRNSRGRMGPSLNIGQVLGMVPHFLLPGGTDQCGADRETGAYGTSCLSYHWVYL